MKNSLDNDQVGIRTSKYKYFRHARNSSLNIHLYDLTLDTLENKNIYQENSEKIHEMEKFIEKFSNFTNDEVTNDEVTNDEVTNDEVTNDEVTNDEVTNDEVTNDEEEAKIREELKKLGYL